MKVFFDTNVYAAEALLGETAEQLIEKTLQAAWRIQASTYILEELERVLTDKLGFSRRLAVLSCQRVMRRSRMVQTRTSRHVVPDDPKDNPILNAALTGGADYLVTNDPHLLSLNPFHGLRIVSMTDYYNILVSEGLIK
jgi:putative PIN family toxin of toxin-antitoxin system